MRKTFLTILFAAMLPLGLMAQGNITEPGATDPNQLYTTTYDTPTDPNQAPGPNRISGTAGQQEGTDDPGTGAEGSPIGAPWVLLGFAAMYGGYRLVRRKRA